MADKSSTDNNDFTVFHANIRGFPSKKESLTKSVKKINPDVILLNETHLKGKNKVIIPSYFSFSKNRSEKAMGGVAIATNNKLKESTIKVKEGEADDEYIICRYNNFQIPINIISYYGEQECRTSNEVIKKKWIRLLNDILKIKARKEACILMGDMNKQNYALQGLCFNCILFGLYFKMGREVC